MEYFIAQAQIILPVLGVNIFRSASSPVSAPAEAAGAPPRTSSPIFTLYLRKDGITATAREIDGEFTVLQGSQARPAWTGGSHTCKALYEKLVEEKILVPESGSRSMRFARDHVFASPSAAAAVVTGRQSNGRVKWKMEGSATTFGDWQTQGIEQLLRERPP